MSRKNFEVFIRVESGKRCAENLADAKGTYYGGDLKSPVNGTDRKGEWGWRCWPELYPVLVEIGSGFSAFGGDGGAGVNRFTISR